MDLHTVDLHVHTGVIQSHRWGVSEANAISNDTSRSSRSAEDEDTATHSFGDEKIEGKLEGQWENWRYVPWKNRPRPLSGRTATPPSPSISPTRRHTPSLGWRILLAIRHTITEDYPVSDDAVLRNVRLFLACSETMCQVDCIRLSRAYEACRTPGKADECASLNASPPQGWQFLRNPSTTVFVFTCLAYAVFASAQFAFIKYDRFRRGFLMIGLVVGFFMSLYEVELGEERIRASTFAYYVTASLLVSACGHWVWWMCFGKRDVQKLDGDEEKGMPRIEEV